MLKGGVAMDYTQQLTDIQAALSATNTILQGIASLLVLFAIVILLHYVYKFFNMFFK